MDEEDRLSKNDPYREMRSDTMDSIRPDLPGDESRKKSEAAASLRGAEGASALTGNDGLAGGMSDALSAEGGDSFVNSVEGLKPNVRRRRGKFSVKKQGPLILILLLVAGIVALVTASQGMMPFAIVNRFIEEYNTNGFSSIMRSDSILDLQISDITGIFGLTEDQQSSLEDNGFKVIDYNGGKVLVYETAERGVWNAVAGTNQYEAARLDPSKFSAKKVITVNEAFSDRKFKNPYTRASKTWRGGISGWYDTIENITEIRLNIRRNRWFKKTMNKIEDAVFDEIAAQKKAASSRGGGANIDQDDTGVVNEDDQYTDDESLIFGIRTSDAQAGLERLEGILNGKAVQRIEKITNAGCALVDVAMLFNTYISVQQTLQSLNVATGYFESVQMVQSNNGGGGVMNEYNARLLEKDSTTGKSAMESAGIVALFTGSGSIPLDEESKRANSFESFMSDLDSGNASVSGYLKKISASIGTLDNVKRCTYVALGQSILDAVRTGVSAAMTIVSMGTFKVADVLISVGKRALQAAVQSVLASLFKEVVIPKLVTVFGDLFLKDIVVDKVGELLGNTLASGANKYMGGNHQTGGGSPGSQSEVTAFKREQEAVIAQEELYERTTRSPFDITSQYTFLGSLAYSLIPFAATSSIGGVLTNISSLTTNAVTKLLPTASAIAETHLIDEIGDCPMLESVGAVGDIYCNPYYVTSNKNGSLESNPYDVLKYLKEKGQIKMESNNVLPEIVSGSDLEKYVIYCGTRTSSFGIADANISDSISKNNSSIWNKIPLVNLIANIVTAVKNLEDQDWVSGKNCVASNENAKYRSGDMVYWQRFVEDQRNLENMKADVAKDGGAVTKTLARYYEDNPIDNSYYGVIARFSGQTKEEVEIAFDTMYYYYYIANYDPSERLAFGKVEEKEVYFEETESLGGDMLAVEPKYVLYNDVRNRVFVV